MYFIVLQIFIYLKEFFDRFVAGFFKVLRLYIEIKYFYTLFQGDIKSASQRNFS